MPRLRPVMLPILVAALALFLSACGSTTKSAAQPAKNQKLAQKTANTGTASRISLVSPGYLTVGSDTSYPPMESRDPQTQQYVGADVDIANALAKAMGLKGARIQSALFDSLIPSLQAKRYDMVMSSMNDTPDRAKQVAFVDYMTATMGILVKKGSPIKANSFGDLCGQSVAVERGTVEQQGLEQASSSCSSKIQAVVSGTDADAYQSFASGHADAYMSDLPVILHYVQTNPSRYQEAGKPISAHANYGIAVRKDNGALKTALREALQKIRGNGEYNKILKKWGVGDAGLSG